MFAIVNLGAISITEDAICGKMVCVCVCVYYVHALVCVGMRGSVLECNV